MVSLKILVFGIFLLLCFILFLLPVLVSPSPKVKLILAQLFGSFSFNSYYISCMTHYLPHQRQPQKLRYIVGIILAEGSDATVVPEHKQLLEENGYQFATFPAIDHAVQTSFPFNSTISIIVAVMKVYPALREYIGVFVFQLFCIASSFSLPLLIHYSERLVHLISSPSLAVVPSFREVCWYACIYIMCILSVTLILYTIQKYLTQKYHYLHFLTNLRLI